MRSPGAFELLVLVFGAFRILRLASYDDFPPVARLRAWVVGEEVTHPGPGPDPVYVYRRPLLAHLVGCVFCLGFWISLAVCGAWWLSPKWAVYVLAPFALSGAIGLIAKVLDG